MFDPSDDKRRKARERTRRYRTRLQEHKIVAPAEVGHPEIDLLIMLNWLAAADSEDPRKIGAAIAALLRDAAKHSPRDA